MTTKPPLQKILKGLLHTEDENKHNHKRMGSIKPHEKNRQALRVALNWLHTLKTTKWQESPHLSILTLNVKGLNSPIKRHLFILSEVSQAQKAKNRMLSLICGL
jgi:hypothetical protein